MPFLTFKQDASCYGYGPGVNASNLTSHDIASANARLAPQRQRRLQDGSLKTTRDDARHHAPKSTRRALMPKYLSWTERELAKAVVARRIKSGKEVAEMYVDSLQSHSKDDLLKALREADKNPIFSRFLILPPELRDRIYKLAIADVSSKDPRRVRPVTPPISRTNRLIRSETLPIFFRGIYQTIIVSSVPAGPASFRLQQAEISDKYQNYFDHAMRVGWLQHMRCFQFRLMGQILGRDGQAKKHWNARYYVQFANNMQTVKTWTGKDEDKEGLLAKIMAGMTATTDGSNAIMTAKEFSAMTAFFLATVDLRCGVE